MSRRESERENETVEWSTAIWVMWVMWVSGYAFVKEPTGPQIERQTTAGEVGPNDS